MFFRKIFAKKILDAVNKEKFLLTKFYLSDFYHDKMSLNDKKKFSRLFKKYITMKYKIDLYIDKDKCIHTKYYDENVIVGNVLNNDYDYQRDIIQLKRKNIKEKISKGEYG